MTWLDDIYADTLHLLFQGTPDSAFRVFFAVLIVNELGEDWLCDFVAFLKLAILAGVRLDGIIGQMD